MNRITIRDIDDELSAAVDLLAKQEGISLSQAALKLLRKGAGLADGRRSTGTIGNSLDHLIGSWSAAEADKLDAALRELDAFGRAESSDLRRAASGPPIDHAEGYKEMRGDSLLGDT